MEYNMLDKEKLIVELREIHKKLLSLYEDMFSYKYDNDEEFKVYIDNEYSQNGINKKDQKSWNQNFCHRASYTLLNKFLFVRICEDKGFMRNQEDYIAGEIGNIHIGKKLTKVGLQKWTNILTNHTFTELINFAFSDMKNSYKNIALYKEDKYEILSPTKEELDSKYINEDQETKKYILKYEKIIEDMIEKLDTEKFDFSKTDSNVLGDVYEQFMDRDTRKAIGQFYTPDFVIEYILKNTVEETDVLENPFVRVADISCGSGHFLIMAYDILRDKFINNLEKLRSKYSNEKYIIRKNGREEKIIGKDYWIEENIHYHILKHCIYGSDIDSFAVQLTTINLLLKDLDNFTDELNIVECDSLIEWEKDYNWEKLEAELDEKYETITFKETNLFGEEIITEKVRRKENYNLEFTDILGVEKKELISLEKAKEIIKMCKFWKEGFDYVIGNPPWISLSGKHRNEVIKILELYYKERYKGNTYMPNLYEYFIKRGMNLLKQNGIIAFIVPDRLGNNDQFIELRKKIVSKNILKQVIYDIDFPDVIADTMIFIVEKGIKKEYLIDFGNLDNTFKFSKLEILETPKYVFKNYTDMGVKSLVNKIQENSICLGNISDITSGFGGKSKMITNKRINENQIEILKGENIETYAIRNNFFFEFKRDNITGRTTDKNKLGSDKKILLRKTGDRLMATYDDSKYYPEQSLYFIYNLNEKYDYYYILSIINSVLMNYFYLNELVTNLNSTPQLKKSDLDRFPIIKVNKDKQRKLSLLAREASRLKSNILNWDLKLGNSNKRIILESYNDYIEELMEYYRLKNEIDENVFQIYNLSKEEINDIYAYFNIKNSEFNKLNELKERLLNSKEDRRYSILSNHFNTKPINIINYQDRLLNDNKRLNLYEISDINNIINKIFNYIEIEIFKIINNNHMYIDIRNTDKIKNDINNFDNIIEVIREFKPTKSSLELIKESINKNTYTWNAYRKAKGKDRINKTFIKYYDSNYYGLSEWSDEIHKHYFLDAIEEYTETDPNEKKAKDILNLFKDLDIEYKKDYIQVIEGKINRVFV